jgi:tRNA (adenine57-N1/adenine58-N1)-methyltransferase
MDFARPHVVEESIVSRSKIQWISTIDDDVEGQEDDDEDQRLDRMVVDTANEVAREFLLGGVPYDRAAAMNATKSVTAKDFVDPDNKNLHKPPPHCLIDASLYKEYSTALQTTIQAGDLVVILEAFDKLDFCYVTPGQIFYNRHGHFRHDDWQGLPFGAMVRSYNNHGYGFVYLLRPTPELWARSLKHRTQIVHELDQTQVVFQLQLRPNMRVLESGTGSAAMSHAILRSIAPKGKLFSYEFNLHRSETAAEEFVKHGVGHLVTVQHQDVCSHGFTNVEKQSIDACFLDLPEPWLAIPHAAFCLKTGARIASYSPCVEQSQKVCLALKKAGFHSLQTMEYRLKEYYVDHAEYEPLPTEPRPIMRAAADDDVEPKVATTKTSVPDADGKNNPDNDHLNAKAKSAPPLNKKRRLVARPFNSIRGHTAFLTYATAGNIPQPNPLLLETSDNNS